MLHFTLGDGVLPTGDGHSQHAATHKQNFKSLPPFFFVFSPDLHSQGMFVSPLAIQFALFSPRSSYGPHDTPMSVDDSMK